MTKKAKLEASLGALRRLYLAEVERFADELRPRFLSGELRGFWTGDGDAAAGWEPGRQVPLYRLEHLCARRFGRTGALGLLAAACSTRVNWDCADEPRQIGGDAAAQDVLAVARRKGWLARPPRPVPTPKPAPAAEAKSLAQRLTEARRRLAAARKEAAREVPKLRALLAGKDFPADFLAGVAPAQRAMLEIAHRASQVDDLAGRLDSLGKVAA